MKILLSVSPDPSREDALRLAIDTALSLGAEGRTHFFLRM